MGETDLEIPGDITRCVFLHHPTISLNLKGSREMGGRRNGDGTILQIAPNPPIPTQITLSVGEKHQLSWNSALFLYPSPSPLPHLHCPQCLSLPQCQCPYITKRRLWGTRYLAHIERKSESALLLQRIKPGPTGKNDWEADFGLR